MYLILHSKLLAGLASLYLVPFQAHPVAFSPWLFLKQHATVGAESAGGHGQFRKKSLPRVGRKIVRRCSCTSAVKVLAYFMKGPGDERKGSRPQW